MLLCQILLAFHWRSDLHRMSHLFCAAFLVHGVSPYSSPQSTHHQMVGLWAPHGDPQSTLRCIASDTEQARLIPTCLSKRSHLLGWIHLGHAYGHYSTRLHTDHCLIWLTSLYLQSCPASNSLRTCHRWEIILSQSLLAFHWRSDLHRMSHLCCAAFQAHEVSLHSSLQSTYRLKVGLWAPRGDLRVTVHYESSYTQQAYYKTTCMRKRSHSLEWIHLLHSFGHSTNLLRTDCQTNRASFLCHEDNHCSTGHHNGHR